MNTKKPGLPSVLVCFALAISFATSLQAQRNEREVRMFFGAYDKDKSRGLLLSELGDTNNDGKVTFKEYAKSYNSMLTAIGAMKIGQRSLVMLFRNMDGDKSKTLDLAELADRNRDGVIDYDEYLRRNDIKHYNTVTKDENDRFAEMFSALDKDDDESISLAELGDKKSKKGKDKKKESDGKLSKDELKKFMAKLAKSKEFKKSKFPTSLITKEFDIFFARWDLNGDDFLTANEINDKDEDGMLELAEVGGGFMAIELVEGLKQARFKDLKVSTPKRNATYNLFFEAADKNGDGFLSLKEAGDADGDESITGKEYAAFYKTILKNKKVKKAKGAEKAFTKEAAEAFVKAKDKDKDEALSASELGDANDDNRITYFELERILKS